MATFDKLLPKQRSVRLGLLLLIDAAIAVLSAYAALWLRFDFGMDGGGKAYFTSLNQWFWVHVGVTLLVYTVLHYYRIMWSRASLREAIRIAELNAVVVLIEMGIYGLLEVAMPRSFFLLSFACQCGLELVTRFSYRIADRFTSEHRYENNGPRTMIFGAAVAGYNLGLELQTSDKAMGHLICYADDNPNIRGKTMNGVRVLGGREDIPRIVKEQSIEQIFIAIPGASPKDRAAVTEICKGTECKVRILPGTFQLVNDEVSVSKLRPVSIEDLLGREQVKVNMDEIAGYVKGRTVLVTGGGGSIGSELCRQVANQGPKLLIIFEIYENNAYAIEQELKRSHPEVPVLALIGSVRNTERIEQVIRDYRPDIVYHAAAHKHVPLMETSPKEAIKNNVFGTFKTAQAAGMYGVKRFVLISTDKAVNPTNIMGASKRMCEMVIQMMDREYPDTDFVAVRFGNVLGSNGSVIPLFKKQIEEGGPVTVTHKDIIRYFMTIPEAVSLVLQAGSYAQGGEIFVLDMGEPVKILTLAEKLIQLSGYKPYEEIEIKFTGLRPGEKLFEEMLMSEEGMQDTPNHMIHIGKPIEMDYEDFKQKLEELYPLACSDEDNGEMKRIVSQIITTYHPQFQQDPYLSPDAPNAPLPPIEQYHEHAIRDVV